MSQAAIPSGGAPHPASAAPSKGDAPSKSEALLEYIQVAAKTMRRTELMYGIMLWLTVLLFFGVTAILIDHWLWEFNKFARFAALAAMIAWSAWWVPRKVLPPLIHHVTPEHAARVIEKQNPEFKDSLISWLQLTREQQNAPVPKGVVSYIGRYAVRNLKERDASDIVDSATLVRLGAAFFGGLLCTAIYLFASPKSGFTSIARMVAPWANIAPASRVQFVEIRPGTTTVTQGSSLPIDVTVRGMHKGEGVRIQYDLSDGQIIGDTIPMVPEIEGISYKLDFGKSFGGIHQPLRYSILAGDGIAGPFDVSVQVVPLVAVDRIELQFPEYTKLKPRSLLQTGSFEAPEGTRVRLSANANQVMKSARIEFDPVIENKAFVRARETIEMQVEPQALTASWIALLDEAGHNPTTTSYRIKATNELKETNPDPIPYSVKVIGDLAPEVFLESGLPAIVEVPINRPREFELRALDPDYGLTQLIALGTQSKSVDVEKKTEVLRTVCFESADGESGQITEVFVFDPAAYGLRPGDELDFVAIARDNRHDPRTLQPLSNETRTLPLRLRVTAAERFGESSEESIASDLDSRNSDPQSPSNNSPDGKQAGPGEAGAKNNPNNVASQPNAPRNNTNNANASESTPRQDGAPVPSKNEPSRNKPERGNRDTDNPQNVKDPASPQPNASNDNTPTPDNQPNPGSNTQQDPSQRSSKSRPKNATKDPAQKNSSKQPGDASQSGAGGSGEEGSDSQNATDNRQSASQSKSSSGKGSSSASQSGNGSPQDSQANPDDTVEGSSENRPSTSPTAKGGNPQRNPSPNGDSTRPNTTPANNAESENDSNSSPSDPQSNASASDRESNSLSRNASRNMRTSNGNRSSGGNRNDSPATPPTHDGEAYERIQAFKDEQEKSQANPDNHPTQENVAPPGTTDPQSKPDALKNQSNSSNNASQPSANASPNANRNQNNNSNPNRSSNSETGSKDSKPSSNASRDRSESGLSNDSTRTPNQNNSSKNENNSGRGQSPDGRANDSGTNTNPESNPNSGQDGSSRSPKPDAQGSQQNPSGASNTNPKGDPKGESSRNPSKDGTKPDKAGQNPSGDRDPNASEQNGASTSQKPNERGQPDAKGEPSGSENGQGMPKEGTQSGNSPDSPNSDSTQGSPNGQNSPDASQMTKTESGKGSESGKPDGKPSDSGNNQQGNNQQGNNQQGNNQQGNNQQGNNQQGNNQQGNNQQGNNQQGNNQQGNNQQGNNQQGNNQSGKPNAESGKPDGQGNSPSTRNSSNANEDSPSPSASDPKGSNAENASAPGKSTSKDGSNKDGGSKNSNGKEGDGQDGRSGATPGTEPSASEQTGSQGTNPSRANQQGSQLPTNKNPNPPVTSRPETVPPQAKRPGDDDQGNPGNEGGDGGSGKSNSQKPTGSQAQSPGAGLNQTGAPSSSAPPGAAERSQGKEYGGEKANIEYADKTTDLLLDYIDRQRDQPDPELLKRLNWSADDLRKFSDRWRTAKEQARQTPEKKAELEASLRSLGLRRTKDTADRLTDRNDNLRGMQEQGSRLRPPDALREQFEAFRKAAGKLDKSP